MRRISFFSLGVFLLYSCNNIPDCDDTNSSDLVIQFMDSTNTIPQEEIFSQIREINNGFVFFEDIADSLVTLEVNPTDTATGFVFEGDGMTDTLIVGYKQNQLLKSVDCGLVLKFSELTILKQTFSDTLIVLNDELLRNEINIEIIR